MHSPSPALTLTVDAQSPRDLVVLLRQALYEIEKNLEFPIDAREGKEAGHSFRRLSASFENPSSVVRGHAEGTIGKYAFEYHLNSREYTALEESLLGSGYTRTGYIGDFGGPKWMYTHDSHTTKIIDGAPLAVRENPEFSDGPL